MRCMVAFIVLMLVVGCAGRGVPHQHASDPENAKVEALVQSEPARQAEAKRPDPEEVVGEAAR